MSATVRYKTPAEVALLMKTLRPDLPFSGLIRGILLVSVSEEVLVTERSYGRPLRDGWISRARQRPVLQWELTGWRSRGTSALFRGSGLRAVGVDQENGELAPSVSADSQLPVCTRGHLVPSLGGPFIRSSDDELAP
jgi:hypothetical protein